jgi:hypothetical protein
MTDFLFDGPEDARVTILLAHGAGAPMDSASMNATTKVLAGAGLRVARFEFGYMAARRTSAGKKPPPKAESVMPEYVAAIDDLGPTNGPLIIGGKSMGGRVASMVAGELFDAGAKEPDPEKRKAIYLQVQKILLDEVPVAWLYEINFPTLYRTKITNLVSSAIGLNDSLGTASIA